MKGLTSLTLIDWLQTSLYDNFYALSPKLLLKREYQTVFGTIVAFTFVDYVEDLLALGRLELEYETTALLVCAAALFLLVRYLHKHTRVLHVAGR